MKNPYRTKDLSETAFLYASGKRLITTENDSGRVWFAFEDRLSCNDLVDSFWRKEATVNAKEFSDAIRTLKDLIFNKERK
jgi:hypothetical protein